MTKYNLTNFTSPTVANKILNAMQDAFRTGLAQHITNRVGRPWLRVDIKRNGATNRLYFQFLTDTMQEAGHHLLKAALFHWSRGDEQEFSGLHAALYRLPAHPLDTLLDLRASQRSDRAMALARSFGGRLTAVVGHGARWLLSRFRVLAVDGGNSAVPACNEKHSRYIRNIKQQSPTA